MARIDKIVSGVPSSMAPKKTVVPINDKMKMVTIKSPITDRFEFSGVRTEKYLDVNGKPVKCLTDALSVIGVKFSDK